MFLAAALPARAQTADPSAEAKVRIGPLAMTPTIALLNAGVDNNVFNEPNQLSPKSDYTFTVEPKLDAWLHVGGTIVIGYATEDLVYYRKYTSERSANGHFSIGLLVPLTRLTLEGKVGYVNTRERPGFEIDARSQRIELSYDGSAEVRVLSKTLVGVTARRQKVDYDKAAVFLDSNLRFELNRIVDTEGVTVRHELTPLTSLIFEAAREQDRFQFSSLRDSDSTLITGGVKFDPFALIRGSATFGYRDFQPRTPGVPGYSGSTASVDLTYVALGSTKVTGRATRDVQYSYDVNQPYYVLTGIGGELAQQIFGPVDVVGRAGVQRLDYRTRAGAVVAAANRTDYVHTYGGGFGYHMSRDFRVGFDVDHSHRDSAVDLRQYNGLRYGLSVTYGF